MKKLLITLSAVAIMLCAMSISAYAATGDIVDTVYTTDILTEFNATKIPSFAIDGQMMIAVEDLRDYGYTVTYDDSIRTLFAVNNKDVDPNYSPYIERGVVGGIRGYVYETDIKLILNGKETPAYAIDGKMAIKVEKDLINSGNVTYSYNDFYRLLSVYAGFPTGVSYETLAQYIEDTPRTEEDIIYTITPKLLFRQTKKVGILNNGMTYQTDVLYDTGARVDIIELCRNAYKNIFTVGNYNDYTIEGLNDDLTQVNFKYNGTEYEFDTETTMVHPRGTHTIGTGVTEGNQIGNGASGGSQIGNGASEGSQIGNGVSK